MLRVKPKSWVIGNWKMNPDLQATQQLTTDLIQLHSTSAISADCAVILAPTLLHLGEVQRRIQAAQAPIQLAAQDVSRFSGTGAYTGDVSAQLLADAQVAYVLVGHSERRSFYAESGDILRQKIHAAVAAGLTVIFCVGETLQEREQGRAEQVVLDQLDEVFDCISVAQWAEQVMVAYEPVWAIGTGKTASPQDADAMHRAIRQGLKSCDSSLEQVAILYGGSVKADNAAALASCAHIDGALVGGASLEADSFFKIIQAFVNQTQGV